MTGLLRRLEREGAIERRPDPLNRRADRWYLLPDGVARLDAARSAGSPVMTQMLSLLRPQEVEELRTYLERCVDGLESGAQRDQAEASAERRRSEARSAP
jgi:DNA-binding MarR family transcriptional regulator